MREFGDRHLAGEAGPPIDPADRGSSRVRALSVFASMVGTLQLSRALADQKLADDVLAQGVESALGLLRRLPEASPLMSRASSLMTLRGAWGNTGATRGSEIVENGQRQPVADCGSDLRVQ
jgi:hypothetical protein